jgi:soluble lytic murein transglycosylase-like protein
MHKNSAGPTVLQYAATLAVLVTAIIPLLVPLSIVVPCSAKSDDSVNRTEDWETVISGWNVGAPRMMTASPAVGYDASILRAAREMNLVVDHFDAWIDQHPGTALTHVKYMSAGMQKNVASTAVFIRKSNPGIDARTAWREAAALVHYSAKYGVPHVLTTAVARVESTFNPDALSSKGASGVMQVRWKLHNSLLRSNGINPEPGDNPLCDPEKAIAAGCLLLSRYIRAYGSVQAAMERYYGGKSDVYQRKVARNMALIMNHHIERAD